MLVKRVNHFDRKRIDYESTYEEFLSNYNSFLFLTRTHRLATEIYKVDNDLSAEYFENLFDFKDRYTAPIFLSLFIYLFIFHQL